MKGVTPCDVKSFIFERVIQRLSALQSNRVKYTYVVWCFFLFWFVFFKKKINVFLAYWT